MQIFAYILFISAYSIGIITLFLELVCYKRKIEYIETVLFTFSFLSLVVTMSIASILGFLHTEGGGQLDVLIHTCIIGLGLTTPLNIFVERQLKIAPIIKWILYGVAAVLFLILIAKTIFGFVFPIELSTNIFLGVSVFSSMLLIRFTKPGIQIKHREKNERAMAIVVMTILPALIFVEFISTKISSLSFLNIEMPITLTMFFIILAVSKIFDDLSRLSLLRPENAPEIKHYDSYNLTQREQEVAELLVKGYTYAKIGESLFISMPTVKSHVSNIYKKVGVKNKMELFYAFSN